VFVVVNPADGNVIGNVPDMVSDDVSHAVEAAYKAFQTWKFTTAKVLVQSFCTVPFTYALHVDDILLHGDISVSDRHPFNGLFSGTTWVSRHQKG